MADVFTASTDVTRPADTTTYAAGDAISDSTSAPTTGGFTLSNMGAASGGSGVITDIWIASSNPAATTALQGELWIFDTAVTAVNDNAAFAISDAEVKTGLAVVPFLTTTDTNNSWAHVQGLAIGYTCVGSANLRFLLKAKNAYPPISGEVITVRVKTTRVS